MNGNGGQKETYPQLASLTSPRLSRTTKIVNCDRKTVWSILKSFEECGTVERKSGSGGHNKKSMEEFLADLHGQIGPRQ